MGADTNREDTLEEDFHRNNGTLREFEEDENQKRIEEEEDGTS
jgi:hypothetical protein